MATKPFTGSSRKLSETETELPRKETETVLPQEETESELPQNRTSEAENSNNQTCNIRKNVITAAESGNVGIFDFNNKYHEGGAVDHHQGFKILICSMKNTFYMRKVGIINPEVMRVLIKFIEAFY
ncbi:unnamed protein product [Prunus armeniaca]